MPAAKALSADKEMQVIEAYKDPKRSIASIAEQFGVWPSTIHNVINRTNTPLRSPQRRQKNDGPRHQLKLQRMAKTLQLDDEGWLPGLIAEELNISITTVYGYLRKKKRAAKRKR